MAIYRYPTESLIDEVQVITNEKGGLRAYLYADNGSDTEHLRKIKQSLRAEGMKCVPTVHEGKPVLEVRGFTKTENLITSLNNLHAFKGTATITAEPSDVRTSKEKWGNATLKLAGVSYNVGDIAYMWYAGGPVVRDWKKSSGEDKFFGLVGILGGIGYALGSFCLTFFGSRDQSINTITAATTKIERFVRKEGYNVPAESSIAFANYQPKRGPVKKLMDTIAKYPSEALNSIYVAVGTCISATSIYLATKPIDLTQSAKEIEKAKFYRKWDRIDIGLGVVTATSAILGLAVKEQKKLDGDPKRHGLGGAIDWIKEKPLRATGIGYMIATGFHAVATVGKWKHRDPADSKYFIGRVIFIMANIFSEAMLTLSSKGHGVGVKPDASVDESVMAAAAELVLRQPPEKRETIISQLSGYIASPDVLATKADIVEKTIRQHLELMDANPWTKYYDKKSMDNSVAPSSEAKASEKPQMQTQAPEPQEKIPGNTVSSTKHLTAGIAANDNEMKPAVVM